MNRHIQTVKKVYADLERGDVEAVMAACSLGSRWTIPSLDSAAEDTLVGRTAIGEFVSKLCSEVRIETFSPESILQDGDWIVAVGRYRGATRATERAFSLPWLHCWRLREEVALDGNGRACRRLRIVSFDDSYDTLAPHVHNTTIKIRAA